MTTLLLVLISIMLVILFTAKFQLHPFFVLTTVALGLALVSLPAAQIVPTLKVGFGNTLASIGLIILFGTTIGVVLDKTRAAEAMALAILRRTGEDRAPRAIALAGFLIGLPIFCDSGFIVLSGLNKSLAQKAGISMTRMAATLAIVMYALHCLIPPHPGITAAAGIMGGSLGKLVLVGTAIAIPASLAGYLWVKWMAPTESSERTGNLEEEAEGSGEPELRLPAVSLSFLPVLIPLLLIIGNSLLAFAPDLLPAQMSSMAGFLGDPVIALFIGLLLSLLLISRQQGLAINDLFVEAVEKAGPILAITAGGGLFGAVIKATEIGGHVSGFLTASHLGLLVPFGLAALLKTAQGSSTVAAITSASLVAPLLPALGLDSEWGRILALLATGAGSMTISHANDSYFWVVTRFSGISNRDTLKVFSTATLVVAGSSLLMIWMLSLVMI